MNIRLILIILLIFNFLDNTAQEVISTQGNSSSNSACTLDYTIGEVVIAFGSDGINDLTQGFHQPVFEITIIEDFNIDFEVIIYPNPAVEQLNLRFDNYNEEIEFQLFDLMGKQLLKSNITSKEMNIPFESYSTGVYFLVFHKADQKILKTYKIQKSH